MLRFLRQMRASLDSFDVLFGLLPLLSAYAAFVAWSNLIVRAIRGEEAEEDWGVTVAQALSGLLVRTLASRRRDPKIRAKTLNWIDRLLQTGAWGVSDKLDGDR